MRIFQDDLGVTLPQSACFLSLSPKAKFSMHMAISTHAPQLVYHSNHMKDAHGAYHLAKRLAELDAHCLGQLVDLNDQGPRDAASRLLKGVQAEVRLPKRSPLPEALQRTPRRDHHLPRQGHTGAPKTYGFSQ